MYYHVFICSDLQAPCAYFGIQVDYLKNKLISKRLEFKEQEGMKQVDQTFTVDKAIFTRDALAKSIYARIFDYLIQVSVYHYSSFISTQSLPYRSSILLSKPPIKMNYLSVFLISMDLKSSRKTVSNNSASIMSMKNCSKFLLN